MPVGQLSSAHTSSYHEQRGHRIGGRHVGSTAARTNRLRTTLALRMPAPNKMRSSRAWPALPNYYPTVATPLMPCPLLTAICINIKSLIDFHHKVDNIRLVLADVVELVDTLDLGSSAVRCGSSSLPIRTNYLLVFKKLAQPPCILNSFQTAFC